MSLSELLNRQKLGMIILYCVLYLASKNINNKIQIIYFDEKNQLILIYSLAAFLFSPLHYLKQIVSKLAARRSRRPTWDPDEIFFFFFFFFFSPPWGVPLPFFP